MERRSKSKHCNLTRKFVCLWKCKFSSATLFLEGSQLNFSSLKYFVKWMQVSTGKSLSEALIFASTIWRQIVHWITSSIHENSKLKPGENMLCTKIVSGIQNNLCKQHVLPMSCKNKSFWQRFTCIRSAQPIPCFSCVRFTQVLKGFPCHKRVKVVTHTVILPDWTLRKWGLSNFAFQHC